MEKKVLLLSQYFPPDINAASFRINDLYNALQKLEFDVTVVTTYPQKTAVEEIQEVDNIQRIELEKVNKKSFINYVKNYFGFMFKSMFYSLYRLRKERYGYIIVTSPPLFVALGGLIVSFFKRSKLVIDIRDVWPDSAVSAGMLKRGGLLYKITKIIERFLYKKADVITCVSNPMRNYIYKESIHSNIHVLYNGISPATINSELQPTNKGHSEKITIGYAGNIGIVQNMNVILKAAQFLPQESKFEFLIIGDGIELKKLKENAEEFDLRNIKFTGALPKNEVLTKLENVDLLFFSLIEDPVFEKTIPSKLFDYLLNNKPIITSIKGEGKDILNELGCALFFDPSNPKSLVNALVEYENNKDFYDEASITNREYVIKNYNREEGFVQFLSQL
ncbi:glycosyltransferase family 4 protein [Virgibacillus salinus]|uniref:Glycosyltransferase involved in cell wall bisynthesis n=1 Tax=Virgibacillus salinus TaxID=553311 RepID=A0A1H0YIJ9_9BACI|nr:glycosyltransferase family 4 protein [Virgibacillus salinus]SDQ15044.1 Glycosyltransferase involved in cell wall bisynthesis [Virgibacillus salinus]